MKISTLSQALAFSGMLAFYASSSVAAGSLDLGALEPGKEYSWPEFVSIKATYTPSQTGPVKFEYSTTPLTLHTTPECLEGSEVRGNFSFTDKGQVMSYPSLTGGTTYYISEYTFNEGTLVIHEGTSELKLNGTTPSLDPDSPQYYGGSYSASKNYEMVVNFNFPVTIGNTFLVAPDNSRVNVTAKVEGASVGCEIAPAMMDLYHQGKIKEGDEVTLRILQVTDAADKENKYNGNGRCELTFKVAAKPLELVEVLGAKINSIENVLNSYYLPGDENALVKFVFDGPLDPDNDAVASIVYGNSDNIDVGMYYEDIIASNIGDMAVFDFAGKLRRPIDMLPASDSSTQPAALYVSFGNLFSPDGQRVYTGSKSNPTGFGTSFNINVLQYTVVGDFTPARGTELVFGAPMEIWVMNGDKITYDSIRFEYTENGEEKFYDIPEKEVSATPDPYSEGAMLYIFEIPELPCDADTPVVVRMTGLQCADGLDHSNDVYGEFTRATSGISVIGSVSDEVLDVYDIAGVRVLKGAKRADLSSLAKGIYVVNGKKVAIR